MEIENNKIYKLERKKYSKGFISDKLISHNEYLVIAQLNYKKGNRMPPTDVDFFTCDKEGNEVLDEDDNSFMMNLSIKELKKLAFCEWFILSADSWKNDYIKSMLDL